MSHPRALELLADGEILEAAAPRRLVQTLTALWSDDARSEGTSRVTWEIERVGDSCRLTGSQEERAALAGGAGMTEPAADRGGCPRRALR